MASLSDDVDAGIDLSPATGPVVPHPDVGELILVPRADLEDAQDEPLEVSRPAHGWTV